LPLGPTGYGNSPYQSLSSFAGNDLLISPEYLVAGCPTSGDLRRLSTNVVAYETGSRSNNNPKKAWTIFELGARTCGLHTKSFVLRRRIGWRTTLFRSLKEKFQDAYYEIGSRGWASSNAPAHARQELINRSGPFRSTYCFDKRSAQGIRVKARVNWGPAVLCITGF
jgi:hypothetical protein